MESQRQVKRKYNNLLKRVETEEFFDIDLSNRVNCYVCDCGHITKTKDVDPGVTPFLHRCEECRSLARSTFYNDIAPDKPHTQEWYRPTLKEVMKMRKEPGMLDHIFNGGLVHRNVATEDR